VCVYNVSMWDVHRKKEEEIEANCRNFSSHLTDD
jgi:hypothetical protein